MTTIMGLLNQIADGEVVLPSIQRDFVWTESQTETLLDSVMRGYPIGIALLWETYSDLQYRPFVADYRQGTLHSYRDNTDRKRIRVVLDGQQRLQSLYIALHGQRDGRYAYFDVLSGQRGNDSETARYLFDFLDGGHAHELNQHAMQSTSSGETSTNTDDAPEMERASWWVRVQDLFAMPARDRRDFSRDLQHKLNLPENDILTLENNLATFDEVFTREQNILKLSTIDENLPIDSPHRKNETDVLEIFVRINREGTSLSRSDLIFSMLKLNWRESAEGLPEFVDAINNGNAFDLDTDFVVRCLFAVSGLGGKLDIDLLRKQDNVAALQKNYERCCDAIRATIDFVQNVCHIENSRLLGSSTTLVPIVHYIYNLPRHEVPNSEMERLKTGVYIFGLARPFSRYGESRVGNFVRTALDGRANGDHTFPLETAAYRVRGWERVHSVVDLAEANHLLTLHLIQGQTGAHVQYSRNKPEIDHIFPRAELRRLDYDEDDINDLANFWVLPLGKNRNKSNRPPKNYFADVSRAQMDRALINPNLLDYSRYGTFSEERRGKMAKKLSQVLGVTESGILPTEG